MTDERDGIDAVPKRSFRMVLLQSVLLVVLAVAIGFWLQREWPSVQDAFASLSPWALVGGVLTATAGLIASAMVWRAVLRGLGQPSHVIPASVVYLVGQLGKFIPGGFWAFLYQIALGMRRGFAKTPTGLAGPLSAAAGLATGATALGLGLSRIEIPLPWLYPILGVAPIIAALIWPSIVNRLIRTFLRLARRGGREITFSRGTIAEIAVWSTLSWFCYGAQLLLLLGGVEHPLTLLETTALVAAAQCVGFLAIIVPSGLGVREAVIVAGLSGVANTGTALTIALAARATSTLGDFLAAGLSSLVERLQRSGRDSLK
jgi:uncharacterized membrane protein YbhN (UPF0104 family)